MSDRSVLEHKLDKAFSLAIRQRDNWTCQRCHKKYAPPTQGLHCSHFWSRRHRGTRWDENNAVAHCYGCHRIVEGDKAGEFRDFMLQKLGEKGYKLLEAKARGTTKFTIQDLKILLASIKAWV